MFTNRLMPNINLRGPLWFNVQLKPEHVLEGTEVTYISCLEGERDVSMQKALAEQTQLRISFAS